MAGARINSGTLGLVWSSGCLVRTSRQLPCYLPDPPGRLRFSLSRRGSPPPATPRLSYLSRAHLAPVVVAMAPGPVLPRTTDPLLICTDSSAPPKWNTILTRIRARGEVYPLQVCADSSWCAVLLFFLLRSFVCLSWMMRSRPGTTHARGAVSGRI